MLSIDGPPCPPYNTLNYTLSKLIKINNCHSFIVTTVKDFWTLQKVEQNSSSFMRGKKVISHGSVRRCREALTKKS